MVIDRRSFAEEVHPMTELNGKKAKTIAAGATSIEKQVLQQLGLTDDEAPTTAPTDKQKKKSEIGKVKMDVDSMDLAAIALTLDLIHKNLEEYGTPVLESGFPDFTQSWDSAIDNIRAKATPLLEKERIDEFYGGKGATSETYYSGPGASGQAGALLDFIGKEEATGRYDIVHGKSQNHLEAYSEKHFGGRELNELTVGEVLEWQEANIADGVKYTAAGKYQFINQTLQGLVDQHKVPLDMKFDSDLQDKLGVVLLERRGLNKFLNGDISLDKFQDNLSKEWASLKNSKGVGHYDNDTAGNFAHGDYADLRDAIKQTTTMPGMG